MRPQLSRSVGKQSKPSRAWPKRFHGRRCAGSRVSAMKHVHWIEPGRLAIRPGPGWKPWDLDELRAAGFQRIVSLDTKSAAVDRAGIERRGMEHVVVRLDDRPPKSPEIRAAYFTAIDQVLATCART